MRWVHLLIIVNFLLEIGYAGFMVFVVLRPEEVNGPLFGAARSLPFEEMMVRRQYAIESWIAMTGLSLYLGMTEVLPRQLRRME